MGSESEPIGSPELESESEHHDSAPMTLSDKFIARNAKIDYLLKACSFAC